MYNITGHVRHSLSILILFFCLFCTVPAYAQEKEEWYEPLFIEVTGQYYFATGFFKERIKPNIGFRAALGYEYRNFRFALESGYTTITGTNPLVIDFRFTPLTFRGGYFFTLAKGWDLQAYLGVGFIFSKTTHYETAFDMFKENKKTSSARSFSAGARAFVTHDFSNRDEPVSLLKFYAGGGIDAIFETGGTIPLPLLEVGISLKPFGLMQPKTASRARNTVARDTWEREPLPIEPEKLVFASKPENVIIEETAQGKTVRLLNAIYFGANSLVMIEKYRPILNEAGERLKANPSLRITLRAYAPPSGDGQSVVSAARAWFCKEHYMKNYGIAEERMKIEYYDAEQSPEFKGASQESYNCVELIIE